MADWARTMLELALPSLCEGCGWRIEPGFVLCATCAARLGRAEGVERTRGEGLLFVTPFRYEGEIAARIMRRFKYQAVERLVAPLTLEMARAWTASGLDCREVCLVPVPASADRVRLRGFNQAALLAAALGETMRLPVAELARRVRATPSQTSLAPAERAENMARAFDAGSASPHRPLVLVDDVVTTGATLDALAHALRARGHRVTGAVAAFRTPSARPGRAPRRRGAHRRFSGERQSTHVS